MESWTIMDLGPATAGNYRRSRNLAARVLRRCKDKGEREIIGGMISDCNFVIERLSTGRYPVTRRGAERLDSYQREISTDPGKFERLPSPTPPRRMTDNDFNRLIQVMAILSGRERQCFEMHHVGLWSEYEIGDHLGITRDSVHEYLERAQRKIRKFISNPIQTELFPIE